MLALTRKKGESIIIADNIEVKILEINGHKVRLGIEAPKNISIYRKEIYDQIVNQNKEAITNLNIEQIKNLF